MNSTLVSGGLVFSYARSSGRSTSVHIDTVLVALVAGILLLGLVMVASASMYRASKEVGDPFYYLEGQLLFAIIGIACAAFMMCVPTRLLERAAIPLLILAVAALFLVLIPGIGGAANGARRWLRVAGFNFQVSELARVFVLIYLASYAVRHKEELRETLSGLAKPLGLLACLAALLLAEPDFGAAAVLFAVGFGLLFVAGARLRYVIGMIVVAASAFAALAWTSPYRKRRLLAFLNPWEDPQDSGYQLTHSLIAIGRGEWLGVGLGESVQKLFYLPEAHTDFLFAVLAEELGLLGVIATLTLFALLVWRSFHIARMAVDSGLEFPGYLAAGFGLWLGVQAFVNIGVNMGVLPTKGLTLPLMSYGRSSLVVTLLWVGIVLRVWHETMNERRGAATVRRRAAAEDDE